MILNLHSSGPWSGSTKEIEVCGCCRLNAAAAGAAGYLNLFIIIGPSRNVRLGTGIEISPSGLTDRIAGIVRLSKVTFSLLPPTSLPAYRLVQ